MIGIDIGNTHTVIGLFEEYRLKTSWRIRTRRNATADEIAALLFQLMAISDEQDRDIRQIIIASVVPALSYTWHQIGNRYFGCRPVFVSSALDTGLSINYQRPYEVGADRIANSVAAFNRLKGPAIVVDYGTAISFDCISGKGEYLGGTIAPGPLLSAEALAGGTALLPLVDPRARPQNALAQDTSSAIRAGLFYGFAGLTDNIIKKLMQEFHERPKVLATGGLSGLFAPESELIEEIIPELTLEGLAVIMKRLNG